MAREGLVGRGGPGRPGRRRGLDRTRRRGVDGPAGRLEDGARPRGRVRREDASEAVRLAGVLPRLPARARRSAAAALDEEPRPARAPRLHGLARVFRSRRDLPQRPAGLPGARVSAGPRALDRLRPPLGCADVGLADVGARRRRGLPPGLPHRAQPRGSARRHRRRPRWSRRRRQDSRRRGAVREHAQRGTLKPCGPKDAEGDVRERIQTNGRCEAAIERGDTYGPVSYLAYVPRSPSSAGAGSGTRCPPRTRRRSRSICSRSSRSCSSDCASAAVGSRCCSRSRGPRTRSRPTRSTRIRTTRSCRRSSCSASGSSRRIGRAARRSRSPAGRSSARFSPRPCGRRTRPTSCRRVLRFAAAFAAATVLAFTLLLLEPSLWEALRTFWEQDDRVPVRTRLAVLDLGLGPVPRAGNPGPRLPATGRRDACGRARSGYWRSFRGGRGRSSSPLSPQPCSSLSSSR